MYVPADDDASEHDDDDDDVSRRGRQVSQDGVQGASRRPLIRGQCRERVMSVPDFLEHEINETPLHDPCCPTPLATVTLVSSCLSEWNENKCPTQPNLLSISFCG